MVCLTSAPDALFSMIIFFIHNQLNLRPFDLIFLFKFLQWQNALYLLYMVMAQPKKYPYLPFEIIFPLGYVSAH
jgi:hypothetical protein